MAEAATIIHVPGDYPTIQAAIDAASSGDTIQVSAGTYFENITLKNGVNVIGAGAGVTTIDGGGIGRVVFARNVGSATRFEGFRITNGSALSGGGMHNWTSSLTIANCVFSGNTAIDYGGGMFNADANPVVTNCVFSDNSADYGGGMANYGSAALPEVDGCTFTGNSAIGGGGIWSSFGSGVHVDDSAFTANSAVQDGGGMLSVNSYDVVVTDSIFTSNSASDGGGMYNVRSPVVANSVFAGNSADRGGGMFNYSESPLLAWHPELTNCTFSGNSADFGGGMFNLYSEPTVTNGILWGDSGGEIYNVAQTVPVVSYSDIQGGYAGGSNIIDVEPAFVNPAADNFHLRSSSPCIDAGNNSAPGLPSADFEGDLRMLDGDSDGLAVVDLGADEWDPANAAPSITSPSDQTAQEGTSTSFSLGSFTDADDTSPWWVDVDWGDGSVHTVFAMNAPGSMAPESHTYSDDGAYTVTIRVTDNEGASDDKAFQILVANVSPSLTITAPTNEALFAAGTAVIVNGSFTDPGSDSPWTVQVKWDPASQDVYSLSAAGSIGAPFHTYSTAGMYTIEVSVTDKDGATDTETVDVIVYDPSAGFVTGAGWIESPAGAYPAYPALTGKATFGFVSRYQQGAGLPTGQTTFQFRPARLSFGSDSYEWLVVAGGVAQYKGQGTINGEGEYEFMLWAADGAPDVLRIKIWQEADGIESVVYDSAPQPLERGNIIIQKAQ
jgi:hypothetical protein